MMRRLVYLLLIALPFVPAHAQAQVPEGVRAMIEAAKRDFIAAGLPIERFFADVFSYATPGASS